MPSKEQSGAIYQAGFQAGINMMQQQLGRHQLHYGPNFEYIQFYYFNMYSRMDNFKKCQYLYFIHKIYCIYSK